MSVPNGSGIYAIVNLVNGKRYYGCASYLRKRRNVHWSLLRRGKHGNEHLQRAFNKYGEQNFEFTVIELVPVEKLLKTEQRYLDQNNGGYNIAIVAGASNRGRKHSAEHVANMKAALKGRVSPMKGKTCSREHLEHLSEARAQVHVQRRMFGFERAHGEL
jgi:group I intron endonuclease